MADQERQTNQTNQANPPGSSAPAVRTTTRAPDVRGEIIREVTRSYLDGIGMSSPPSPAVMQREILDAVGSAIDLENATRPANQRMKLLRQLTNAQIADIILHMHDVVNVAHCGIDADPEYDVLSMYQHDGKDAGIYVSDLRLFRNLICEYNYDVTDKDIAEILNRLRDRAPRVERSLDRNLVPVDNGVFDYDRKVLMDFGPHMVFVSKSRVDYRDAPPNPVITNPDGTRWDVESWMLEIAGSPEMANLLWQIVGAVIRPLVRWDRMAWFYSDKGNNGKGTLCSLMEHICGEGTCVSLPLADFSKDFMLEPLLRASAIITHENDVGEFVDKAGNLKAVVTGDPISINRKHKSPVTFVFRGFMVQCINDYPRIRDKSESMARREMIIPFSKSFTGRERKYIKEDYLRRPEVLEYVLWRVLKGMPSYYELDDPDACLDAMEAYKESNDPVRQFAADVLPGFTWDLLPSKMLYDCYKKWTRGNVPSGIQVSNQAFFADFKRVVAERFPDWRWSDTPVRAAGRMSDYQPVLGELGLLEWMKGRWENHPAWKTDGPLDWGKEAFRGLVRDKQAGPKAGAAAEGALAERDPAEDGGAGNSGSSTVQRPAYDYDSADDREAAALYATMYGMPCLDPGPGHGDGR